VKRYLLSCIITLIGIAGAVLVIGGILFLPNRSFGVARVTYWRVISIGMIIGGFYGLLYRKSDPDYVPQWYKRSLLYFALFWFLVGGVIFVLSWLID
jgi:hypothetical protein